MKMMTILSMCVLALFVASCEDGPSGPHPTQELKIIYDAPPVTGIQVEVSGRMITSGQVVAMTSTAMPHDSIFASEVQLGTSPVSLGSTPALRLVFKTLPTGPGTFAFTSATVVVGTLGFVPQSEQGAFVSVGGNLYAPISGSITITDVRKDGDVITGYSGYVNGQLQAMWPRGFTPTPSQPFPPGFSMSSPTLVGETLTLHSAVFRTRSFSRVRPTSPQ
jgi:hypothetical protein